MRAISLHQPWATLIAIGVKPYETRGYHPPAALIGRRIAIHAAQTRRAARDLYGTWRADDVRREILAALAAAGISGVDDLPFGAVVCTAVLRAAYRCGDPAPAIAPEALLVDRIMGPAPLAPRGNLPAIEGDPFGHYAPGRWAWRLTDVRRLEAPLPLKGRQGWFELPDDMSAALAAPSITSDTTARRPLGATARYGGEAP